MAHFIQSGGWAAPAISVGRPNFYRFANSTTVYFGPSYANNLIPSFTNFADSVSKVVASAGIGATTWPLDDAFTGVGTFTSSMLYDYRFRFWTIPTTLNLSNPTLGADIPFRIWNTFPQTGTLTSVSVLGSSVLSFDYVAGNTIQDNEFKEVNMQIAAGEPTIDARVLFNHNIGTATLGVTAIVAETFPILPEVPVNETWEFKTDIITNYKGVEYRHAHLLNPRIAMSFNVKVVDYEERRVLYDLTAGNIKVPSTVPMFQYASPVTALTAIGGSRIYFDPALCNARVGRTLILLNRATGQIQLGAVTTLHADGATLNAAVGLDIEPPLWFAVPGISTFLKDDSGFDFGTQAGTYSLQADSIETWALQRPGATQTITTYDSLPVIEKPFLITTPERFAYRRELLDNEIGKQEIRSRDTNFEVRRSLKFSVDRQSDEMDYWREFFALVVGAQKPFLAETQLPDLTLRLAHIDGASQFDINETYYEAKLFPLDTFKRLKVAFTDGTFSYHNVTASVTDAFSNTQISFTPALALGKVVSRISFLQKVRASDRVSFEHYNDYSYVKFGVRTTNT
ncbi:MAG TPA: hypothetical protein VIG24_15515 [Acidimicrobiia bacterium]